jgi:hypothetical protein
MLELPYLSEERLEKLGVPLGPRIRQGGIKILPYVTFYKFKNPKLYCVLFLRNFR